MQHQRRDYPTAADNYDLVEECGRGVSATVYRAICKPFNEEVAVKLLDLENMNCSLDEIVREAQTMRQLNHPNLLPLHCSFVHKEHLWMVMPYVQGGSVLNIMRFAYPDGLEEPVIATIMKDVLKALEYLHRQGIIHRDIKAGNILLGDGGQVLLADFGVAATLERGGSWGNRMMSRNTFVGTPCWMAPEVMEQSQGYDARADIWSFGITLLELAHGHAPFARLPPMKVLLMTIQNPPPTLDTESSKKHFSKAMRELVTKCLVKDPTKRPTAAQLLEHKFFKTAHDSQYLQKHLLVGLPPAPERVQMMRQGHAARQEVQDKDILASQQEYRKGVSSWNFDVAALKAAAAAAREDEDRLPPISEASEVADLMAQQSNAAAAAAAAAEYAAAAAGRPPAIETAVSAGSMGSPLAGKSPMGPGSRTVSGSERPPLPGGGGTPSKARQGSLASAGGSLKPAAKEQGRFKVYEGDEPPPFSTPPEQRSNGTQLMEEFMRRQQQGAGTPGAEAAELAGASEAELQEKAKRKGRFRYVEDDYAAGAGAGVAGMAPAKSAVGLGSKSASLAGLEGGGKPGGSAAPSPTSQAVQVLLGPLKEMMESMTLQQEVMREMVAAVSDAERGKQGALNAFLAERHHLRPQRDETDRLRAELLELREENTRLQDRLRHYESSGSLPESRKSSATGEAAQQQQQPGGGVASHLSMPAPPAMAANADDSYGDAGWQAGDADVGRSARGCWDTTYETALEWGGRLYCWGNREPILTIRRVLWVISAGWVLAIFYWTYALGMLLSIVFAPFAWQAGRLGLLALDGGITLEPYSEHIVLSLEAPAWGNPAHPWTIAANVVWCTLFGWHLALIHLAAALVQVLTIVGAPTALTDLQLAAFALWPFGRHLRKRQLPTTLDALHVQWEEAANRAPYHRVMSWV
ncbi:serine threonine-kinase 4-like isoform X1 [Micractinium conductrix]|uniref:Serine threonine-kinase 4-like isoform X1 n=1 Tax=Micractinium conductrix TaxID=554055 RepID=A0A2P6V9C4_9CHLO|nr:serine threonine-kinase 4-like isoform X1 [Micractinium conductrix]|eukprot:PSC70697.1 serine threonine-kinase 4-like isoform X1 [Micractinium conductrix]